MKNSNYKKEIDDIQADKVWMSEMKQTLSEKQEKKKFYMMKYAMASIVCAVIALGVWYVQQEKQTSPIPSVQEPQKELAILSLEDISINKSMGREAIMQKHPEDMRWDSPWDFDNGIHELPVFKNRYQKDEVGVPEHQFTEKELYEIGKSYIDRFGFTIESHRGENVIENYEGITTYIFQCKEAAIWVEQKNSIAIWFTKEYMEEHAISLGAQNQTKQQAQTSLEQAYANFAYVFNFENPVYQVDFQYNYAEEEIPFWDYSVYEGKGSQDQQLIEKVFRPITFYTDEKNQLWGMRIYQYDTSDTVNHYPIVGVEEATTRLKNGQFFASAPTGDFEQIVHVEMTYNNNQSNEYLMPYYKFYALLEDATEENRGDLSTYGAYYVPAIKSEYLKELPQKNNFYN